MARQQATPHVLTKSPAMPQPSRRLTEIGTPRIDWVSLAKGMGMKLATRATTCEEFHEQLNAALEYPGPSLIEAALS